MNSKEYREEQVQKREARIAEIENELEQMKTEGKLSLSESVLDSLNKQNLWFTTLREVRQDQLGITKGPSEEHPGLLVPLYYDKDSKTTREYVVQEVPSVLCAGILEDGTVIDALIILFLPIEIDEHLDLESFVMANRLAEVSPSKLLLPDKLLEHSNSLNPPDRASGDTMVVEFDGEDCQMQDSKHSRSYSFFRHQTIFGSSLVSAKVKKSAGAEKQNELAHEDVPVVLAYQSR